MKRAERHAAKLVGAVRYFTGRPCKRGHVAERFTSTKVCVVCSRLATDARNVADNYKSTMAVRARCVAAKPEQYRQRRRDSYAGNPQWQAKAFAAAKLRQLLLEQRVPAWADRKAIAVVYLEARSLRDQGQSVEVDHVIPLRGENVSGLHVANNLQIIHSLHNRAKSNRFQENFNGV